MKLATPAISDKAALPFEAWIWTAVAIANSRAEMARFATLEDAKQWLQQKLQEDPAADDYGVRDDNTTQPVYVSPAVQARMDAALAEEDFE